MQIRSRKVKAPAYNHLHLYKGLNFSNSTSIIHTLSESSVFFLFNFVLKKIIIKQMGSLMAGWASPVPDPKVVKYQRNRSLTREEIDTYWKSKKQKEEEHVKEVSEEIPILEESEKRYQRSSSLPLANTKGSFLGMETGDDKASLEKLILKNGWWTSSSSAFLNEPPVIEESNARYSKYAAQFHVASLGASKTNGHTGIST